MSGTWLRAPVSIRLHKVLLVAAVGTFIFAVVWLIAPWVSSRMQRDRTQPARPSNASAVAKPRSYLLPTSPTWPALRNVAEQGDPAAQFALGARYATGEEVKQDYTEAVQLVHPGGGSGTHPGPGHSGRVLLGGPRRVADLTKAYFWSALAQAGGDQASKYRVAVLTSRMSRSQILAAQQQANDWLSNHPAANVPSSQ